MTVAVPSSSDQHLSPAWPSTHTHVLPSLHSRPGLSSPLHHPLPPPRLHRPSPQKTPLLCPTQRQRKPPRLHRHSKQRHPRLDSHSQRARRSLCESSPISASHLFLPFTQVLATDIRITLFRCANPKKAVAKVETNGQEIVITGAKWKDPIIKWLEERGF